ncbi:MAG TPA: amidohydrolase [Mycobacteriales bacterium]
MAVVDVHQHLWPAELVEALRRRRSAPRLDGWTLVTDGEPPYAVRPDDHDPVHRAALAAAQGTDLALVSLSSPLGIEHLGPDAAATLLDAYHDGVAALPTPFRGWAAAQVVDPDPGAAEVLLGRGFVGLQLPATALADPAGWERCGPLLDVLERAGAPLFVHPGPAAPTAGTPAWWPALTDYVAQLQRSWYAFRLAGRPNHPGLRVCFAMLAGLAPVHGERFAARAGTVGPVDRDAFVETSSYGPLAVAATVRALDAGVVVRGSDTPYAEPADPGLGDAGNRAVGSDNPARLLGVRWPLS